MHFTADSAKQNALVLARILGRLDHSDLRSRLCNMCLGLPFVSFQAMHRAWWCTVLGCGVCTHVEEDREIRLGNATPDGWLVGLTNAKSVHRRDIMSAAVERG